MFRRFSEENFPECFREYAEMLTWDRPWHTTLDTTNAPFWKWFVGGRLNASKNCVDRHLLRYRNKAAIIFMPELESEGPAVVTYQDLHVRVNEFAALLRDFASLRKGDRVTFHLPMVPDLPISMLAAARLGVTGTSKYLFDIHPEDVYWCLADIGWITGHSYIVYGPLALAATTVIRNLDGAAAHQDRLGSLIREAVDKFPACSTYAGGRHLSDYPVIIAHRYVAPILCLC